MNPHTIAIALGAIALLNGPAIRAQSQERFDVASVKVNTTRGWGGYPGLAPGGQRFTATNLPLVALIILAYDVTPGQVSGLPDSFNTEGYDIEAKCDHPIKQAQALRMLQTLLADRFKLSVHCETREQPIYALVIAKGGTRLHGSQEELSAPDIQKAGNGGLAYRGAPLSVLTLILSQQVGRTVVDQTGLKGQFDFSLAYARERVGRGGPDGSESAPNPGELPSVFTAVQEQLGLKLESQKGPVEFIIVDHAEKPSGN